MVMRPVFTVPKDPRISLMCLANSALELAGGHDVLCLSLLQSSASKCLRAAIQRFR